MKLTNIEMKQLENLKRKMGAGVLFDHLRAFGTVEQLSDEAVLIEVKEKIWGKLKIGSYEMAVLEQLIERYTYLRWKNAKPEER